MFLKFIFSREGKMKKEQLLPEANSQAIGFTNL